KWIVTISLLVFFQSVFGQIDLEEETKDPRVVVWEGVKFRLDTSNVDSISSFKESIDYHNPYSFSFNSNFFNSNFFNSLSFLGSQRINQDRGYDMFSSLFSDYRFGSDQKYFNVTAPVTLANYWIGPKEEQGIEVFHSQNISPGFNLSARYRNVSSDGVFPNQSTKNSSFTLGGNYFNKTGSYLLFFDFGVDNSEVSQNGGLFESDTVGTSELESNPLNNDALIESGYLNDRDFHFNIQQYVFLKNDSSGHFGFTHSAGFGQRRNRFVDNNTDSAHVSIYDLPSEIGWMTSELRSRSYENEFGLSFKHKGLVLDGGFGLWGSEYDYKSTFHDSSLNRQFLFVDGSLNISDDLLLSFGSEYTITGFNSGGYESSVNADYFFGSSDNWDVGIHSSLTERMPSIQFLWFESNKSIGWRNNDLDKPQSFNSGVYIEERSWFRLGAEYHRTDNYLFYDSELMISQEDLEYYKLSFEPTIDLGVVGFTSRLNYFIVESETSVRFPEWRATGDLYYENDFFKDALRLKTGLKVHSEASYTGYGYVPLYRSVYLPDETEDVGGFLFPIVYANFTVQNVEIFVSVSNFYSDINEKTPHIVDGYPLPPSALRFGLSWTFFR
ncbi:putative porin, partial [Salibacter sp.]|uniref:putative porin n=1 Tax=Salibacter sp. TaxID=2010995 RepID=UPI0028701980